MYLLEKEQREFVIVSTQFYCIVHAVSVTENSDTIRKIGDAFIYGGAFIQWCKWV